MRKQIDAGEIHAPCIIYHNVFGENRVIPLYQPIIVGRTPDAALSIC